MACGGCHYQHADYLTQVELKVSILREQLRRVGHIQYEGEIGAVTGPPLEYRNRSQFHMENGEIGYFAEGTHAIVPIARCAISSPMINEALAKLRRMIPRFVKRFELFTNEREVQLNIVDSGRPLARRFFEKCATVVPGINKPYLDYPVDGFDFRIGHNAFFQVNRFLLDQMVQLATEGAAGKTAVDLYAGVGLFSARLSKAFEKVIAVEMGANASRDLAHNLEKMGPNTRSVRGKAEEFLASLDDTPDFILADPPRAGLGKIAVRELLRLKPPHLVVVSCDPSTMARDLQPLVNAGYKIEKLTLVDLFPQTFHLESVVQLRLGEAPASPSE